MRGFTLIELIACILIIGVLAALSGSLFVGTGSFDQRGYADELAAALRYADDVAAATGCNVSFTVTSAGFTAMQQPPPALGNTCAAAGAYTQQVERADGTPLSGTPPSDANVTVGGAPCPVSGCTIIFGTAGQVVSWSGVLPPTLAVGPFTLTVDTSSGFVNLQSAGATQIL
jgi:MSHA pilin protein MshC